MRMGAALQSVSTLTAVALIKEALAIGHKSTAAEAYAELSREEERALWVAPSRGGVWTTAERHLMKTDPEWRQMVQHHRGPEWHDQEENGI